MNKLGQELGHSVQVVGVKGAIRVKLGQVVGHSVQVEIEHRDKDASIDEGIYRKHGAIKAEQTNQADDVHNKINERENQQRK